MRSKVLSYVVAFGILLVLQQPASSQTFFPSPPVEKAPVSEENESQITELSKKLSCFEQGGVVVPGKVVVKRRGKRVRSRTFVSYASIYEKKLKRIRKRLNKKKGKKKATAAVERRREKFEEKLSSLETNCEEEVKPGTSAPAGTVSWLEVSTGLTKPYQVDAGVHLYKGSVITTVRGPTSESSGIFSWDESSSSWVRIATRSNGYGNGIVAVVNDVVFSFREDRLWRLDGNLWTELPKAPFRSSNFKAFNGNLYILDGSKQQIAGFDVAAGTWGLVIPENLPFNPIASHHTDFFIDGAGDLFITKKWEAKDLKENRNVIWKYTPSGFVDVTGTLDVRNMLGACCGPLGDAVVDSSGVLRISSEWGIWRLLNGAWEQTEYFWGNSRLGSIGEYLFVKPSKTSQLERHKGTRRWHLFPPTKDSTGCKLEDVRPESDIASLDNGETLFAFIRQSKDCGVDSDKVGLMYRMIVTGQLPYSERNLPASTATYLGGSGDDEARGAAFTEAGNLVVAGNFSQVAGNVPVTLIHNGASATSPAKLLLMDAAGKVPTGAIALGNRVDDLDNGGAKSGLVAGGDFGVVALDKEGTAILWSNPLTGVPSGDGSGTGGQTRVATSAAGATAVLRGKTVFLFNSAGQLVTSRQIEKSYLNDIAIAPDGSQVYVVGFSNQKNEGVPVQVALVWALSGVDLGFVWKTFDFDPDSLDQDMADTRLYRVAYGDDGELYVLGESAGGNTIFRWNGKDLSSSRLIKYDIFNDAFNAGSAHFAFYARINPQTGEVKQGQFAVPRLSSTMKSNTFRVENGSIAADALGRVYVAGLSAFGIAGRDLSQIAGQRVGKYIGADMTLLVVGPAFQSRLRWTPLNKNGKGGLNAIALSGSQIAAVGTVTEGEMITHEGLHGTPFNPEEGVKDAYLVRWQE